MGGDSAEPITVHHSTQRDEKFARELGISGTTWFTCGLAVRLSILHKVSPEENTSTASLLNRFCFTVW